MAGKRWQTAPQHLCNRHGRMPAYPRPIASSLVYECFLNAYYVGAVSLLTIAVSAEKEAWHDHPAKTRVVNGRPPSSGPLEQWRILLVSGSNFCGW